MQRPDERELREQLARLRAEHRDLDAQIVAEETSPLGDQLQIKRLKKRKLSLKDRIEDAGAVGAPGPSRARGGGIDASAGAQCRPALPVDAGIRGRPGHHRGQGIPAPAVREVTPT